MHAYGLGMRIKKALKRSWTLISWRFPAHKPHRIIWVCHSGLARDLNLENGGVVLPYVETGDACPALVGAKSSNNPVVSSCWGFAHVLKFYPGPRIWSSLKVYPRSQYLVANMACGYIVAPPTIFCSNPGILPNVMSTFFYGYILHFEPEGCSTKWFLPIFVITTRSSNQHLLAMAMTSAMRIKLLKAVGLQTMFYNTRSCIIPPFFTLSWLRLGILLWLVGCSQLYPEPEGAAEETSRGSR